MRKNKFNDILTPPHAKFTPNPLHQFTLKYRGRDIAVVTDYPLTKKNSAEYKSGLQTHVAAVEESLVGMLIPPRHKKPTVGSVVKSKRRGLYDKAR